MMVCGTVKNQETIHERLVYCLVWCFLFFRGFVVLRQDLVTQPRIALHSQLTCLSSLVLELQVFDTPSMFKYLWCATVQGGVRYYEL
jgi:hypothetical protein